MDIAQRTDEENADPPAATNRNSCYHPNVMADRLVSTALAAGSRLIYRRGTPSR